MPNGFRKVQHSDLPQSDLPQSDLPQSDLPQSDLPQATRHLHAAQFAARRAAGRLAIAAGAALGLVLLAALLQPPPLFVALILAAAVPPALDAARQGLRLRQALRAGTRALARLTQAAVRAERAIADAQAENAAKSRFLAEMSHELRTPLNAVIGFSEMMADEVLGAHAVATYGDYARDIHSSGRHLLALADDILDVARIETGHRTLLETAVGLDALAADCAHMMRLSAHGKAMRLAVVASPAAPRLWADERALRQITLNLLANAVKFTPAGGTVCLHVGTSETGAPFLAIEDTGPGIGAAELPLKLSAHNRESRLDLATGRGAGLGLAIARGLAALHGARLTLEARPAGGTRAQVTFPPSRALPAGEAERVGELAPGEHTREQHTSEDGSPQAPGRVAHLAPAAE
ncbi:MAG TPA: HAMP domain-containing sensor histidine kinase [Xanthobacteraceae bacterium]|jgi:two-component system cell cycle sensor histidine kinase PleC|nr:HAMP domain-containing sensor histidine kinase [Xanthobacteraceae bacterium]